MAKQKKKKAPKARKFRYYIINIKFLLGPLGVLRFYVITEKIICGN
jgi:hypothetical protein